MKKSMLMIAVLAMSALAMVSCKKDKEENNGNGITTIFAKMDGSKTGGEKTHLDGTDEDGHTATLWSKGDTVGVFTGTGTPIKYTLASGENTSSATFSGATLSGEAPYCAFYPYMELFTATRNDDNYTVTFTLPATQTYQAPKGGNPTFAEATAPMIAYSTNGSNYTFKNVMGTLKVDLKGTGKVGKLVLIDNNSEAKLYGTATVSVPDETEEPTATISEGGSNTLTLDCGGGVTLFEEAATSFYFVVPVGTLGTEGFKIDVYDIAGTKKATVDKSNAIGDIIRRNVISTTRENVGEVSVRGLFNINDVGGKVYFSQGNLQYQASTKTWRFAENQWNFVGDNSNGNVYENGEKCSNKSIAEDYSGWIDLFGWATSGQAHGGSHTNPWDHGTTGNWYAYNKQNYDLNEAGQSGKADWGYNAISNGLNKEQSGWRTLSQDEWNYLFIHNTWGFGQINGSNGIIILPDGHVPAEFKAASEDANRAWNANTYNYDTWQAMDANGAVFLPAAGYRHNATIYELDECHYWSTRHFDAINSYRLWFQEDPSTPSAFYYAYQTMGRYEGASVRLVKNAN